MPALTRAQAETLIVDSTLTWLDRAGLATTIAGSNADLAVPIGNALRDMGISVDDPSDPDLSSLASSQVGEFLLRAELYTLEKVAGRVSLYDQTLGAVSKKLSQLGQGLMDLMEWKRTILKASFGVGLGTLTGGTIGLDFAEQLPETEDA